MISAREACVKPHFTQGVILKFKYRASRVAVEKGHVGVTLYILKDWQFFVSAILVSENFRQ